MAFVVADAWQGRGISTILLAHLAEVAETHGISTFVAEVLPHNHRMIDVFRRSGFPVDLHSVPGALEIELPTSLSAGAIDQFEERERSGGATVKSFLEPHPVAVIGASRRRGTIGGEILHNLIATEFRGRYTRSTTRLTSSGRCRHPPGSRTCCCTSARWSRPTPEIVELDCNRVVAGPDGAVIVDARVRVEMVAPPRPMPSLEA